MSERRRVVIDARFPGGGLAGGVETYIATLIPALASLERDDLDLVALVPDHRPRPGSLEPGRLAPHVWVTEWPAVPQGVRRVPTRALRFFRRGRLALERRLGARRQATAPAVPDGFGRYESLGADAVHFAHQAYERTSLPVVYSPHDLQHEHFPGFFSPRDLAIRRAVYPVACRGAAAVLVDAEFTRGDVAAFYGIDRGRIHCVPLAGGELPEPTPLARLGRYHLPARFALMPAQTWPHKNHLGLLRALALLRDRHGVRLDVVCTGRQNSFYPTVVKAARDCGLSEQVRFTGFVPAATLAAFYRRALFVVIPSLFEGAGLPLLEAFRAGAPVACSSAASLPEYGGDAVLRFPPQDDEAIALALRHMAEDEALRRELRERGRTRVGLFGAERMARATRAVYRLALDLPISRYEAKLLETTPLAAT